MFLFLFSPTLLAEHWAYRSRQPLFSPLSGIIFRDSHATFRVPLILAFTASILTSDLYVWSESHRMIALLLDSLQILSRSRQTSLKNELLPKIQDGVNFLLIFQVNFSWTLFGSEITYSTPKFSPAMLDDLMHVMKPDFIRISSTVPLSH